MWVDRCGHEDLRRNPRLTSAELKTIIDSCPNLQMLTFYNNHELNFIDLIVALKDTPASRSLESIYIASCSLMTSLDREIFPHIQIEDCNSPFLDFLMVKGMRLTDFFNSPLRELLTIETPSVRDLVNTIQGIAQILPHLKLETVQLLLSQRDATIKLAQASMNFMEFDALLPAQQSLILSKAELLEPDQAGGLKRASDESTSEDERGSKRRRNEES